MHNIKNNKAARGFTLVELAVSIVVISLIVTSIVAGQSLVLTAKLRSIITETDMYKVAYRSFIAQYEAIPGDMPNAFDYWGAAVGCTNKVVSKDITGCNGNGDRKVNGPVVFMPRAESNLAWQFMALSGFITGKYSGASSSIVGDGMPAAKYDKAVGVGLAYASSYSSFTSATVVNSISIPSVSKNFLLFGKIVSGATVGGFLSPADTQSIDIKIDDGKPTVGSFLAYTGRPLTTGPENPVVNFCTTDNPYTDYILTHKVGICAIMIAL